MSADPAEEGKSVHPAQDVVAAEHLLASALGGWRGVIDSGLPTAMFLVAWTVSGNLLSTAVTAAAVGAAVLVVLRLVRRQSLQQVLSGLVGVAVAVWFTTRTGKAEDFFLPGILTNAAYGTGIALSIIARHPAIGYVVGALTGDLTGWRRSPAKLRLYTLVSWWWVGMFTLRLSVQLPLYLAGNLEWLGTAKLALGWPLYLAVVWVTYRAVTAPNRQFDDAID